MGGVSVSGECLFLRGWCWYLVKSLREWVWLWLWPWKRFWFLVKMLSDIDFWLSRLIIKRGVAKILKKCPDKKEKSSAKLLKSRLIVKSSPRSRKVWSRAWPLKSATDILKVDTLTKKSSPWPLKKHPSFYFESLREHKKATLTLIIKTPQS